MMHTDRKSSVEQSVREVVEAIRKAREKGDASLFILTFHMKELDRIKDLVCNLPIKHSEYELLRWQRDLLLEVDNLADEFQKFLATAK